MWKLLRGSGYGGYDRWTGESITRRDSVGELDLVDCAGVLRLRELYKSVIRHGWLFAQKHMERIMDVEVFRESIMEGKKGGDRRISFTNHARYHRHLETLAECGVIERVPLESLKDTVSVLY